MGHLANRLMEPLTVLLAVVAPHLVAQGALVAHRRASCRTRTMVVPSKSPLTDWALSLVPLPWLGQSCLGYRPFTVHPLTCKCFHIYPVGQVLRWTLPFRRLADYTIQSMWDLTLYYFLGISVSLHYILWH